MKHKSIGCDIRSLWDCARTRILEAWSRRMLAKAKLQTLCCAVNSGTMPFAFPRTPLWPATALAFCVM